MVFICFFGNFHRYNHQNDHQYDHNFHYFHKMSRGAKGLQLKVSCSSSSLECLVKDSKILSAYLELARFLFHELYVKDTNVCDDGNHDANAENNEAVEVIWGPPSPTIDFSQPSVTPAHTSTLSTIAD